MKLEVKAEIGASILVHDIRWETYRAEKVIRISLAAQKLRPDENWVAYHISNNHIACAFGSYFYERV